MKKTLPLILSTLVLVLGCDRKEAMVAPDTRPRVRVCQLTADVLFVDSISLQGSVRAKYTAAVASRLPGTIDEVKVDEGDFVKAGQALFQVDRVNLENHLAIAKADQVVVKAQREEALAAQSEAQATYDKALLDEARYNRLYNETQSVTKDAWEKTELQLRSTLATLERAKAAVAVADSKILQMATSLLIAEKNLADSQGAAPFDGVVTQKLKDRGDYAEAGTQIFVINNPLVYEACFMMNAARYADVKVGETKIVTSLGQTLPVTYKAPMVNDISRTFEVRVRLNADAAIAPGMLCDGQVVFSERKGVGLPAGAVCLRGGKLVAFVVDQAGIVKAVEVQKGARSENMVEISNPEAFEQAQVVSEGMLLLNPGDCVKTVE
ncbi:MAG: efflux RND transporter periplasmic adaptor subunit [Kiritimatiellia bacterium]